MVFISSIVLILAVRSKVTIEYLPDNAWQAYPATKPTYGRYEVYRASCDKQHYLVYNGTGWSSEDNTVTAYREIVNPAGKVTKFFT